MKKITIYFMLFIYAQTINAQITLDYVYPNASTKLYMVNLEVSGIKYVLKSDVAGNRFINFYNLNHSLWKTINCNSFPMSSTIGPTPTPQYAFDALYISEKLFNCDNNIEFMYVSTGIGWFTAVYDEFGTALLLADSSAPFCKLNIPNQFKPIYNTPNGTKLILSHKNGSAKVYNLPCSLTPGLNLDKTINNDINESTLVVYPNPSFYHTTIKFSLPNGVNYGNIILKDLLGKEIKRYKIDNTFSELLIEQDQIPAGIYIYSLETNNSVIDSKKIILKSN